MAERRSLSSSSTTRTPLHNFTFPDDGLKWGVTRNLRCMLLPENTDAYPIPASNEGWRRGTRVAGPTKRSIRQSPDEIDAVRERIMMDLREAAERLRISIEEEDEEKPEEKKKEKETEEEEEGKDGSSPLRPWNLRTRSSACNEPPVSPARWGMPPRQMYVHGGSGGRAASPVRRNEGRMRGGLDMLVEESLGKPAKFSFALTKKEIEADFIAMTGAKPPRRPRRRPKAAQKRLDALVPGLWLSEQVKPENYGVSNDVPERRKSQRGKQAADWQF